MAVGLGPLPEMRPVPGLRLGIGSAGIKRAGRKDVVIMELAPEAVVAGVFTTNAFCAAPVTLCQRRLSQHPRYMLVNTGNANAGTGKPGMAAAEKTCQALAELTGVNAEQVLPFSTGVIGELLPADKIIAALPDALANLRPDNWPAAASGIMTTDTLPKGSSRKLQLAGTTITITGISKGAGMIRPNMATMLGYIATDARISQALLQNMVKTGADQSFNRITIDGDTSTNDSCMLIATNQADMTEITDVDSAEYEALAQAVNEVMRELAQFIVRDGEGATKFVTIQVNGGGNRDECLDVAYAVAHSPLIKTALFASDPNWGRILAAVGYAGVPELNVELIDVYLDDVCITHQGSRADSYTEDQGARVMQQPEITIRIELNRGDVSETLWTTDLSHEYVRINAEYRS